MDSNKRNPFKVPERYFEKLEEDILGKTVEKRQNIRPMYWRVAAGLALVLGMGYWWVSKPSVPTIDMELAYIQEHVDHFELELLAELTDAYPNEGEIEEESYIEELPLELLSEEDLIELLN